MLSRIKALVVRLYLRFFGGRTAWLLSVLARSQLSRNPLFRAAGYLPFQLVDALLGADALRLISYVSLREAPAPRSRIRDTRLRSFLYLAVSRIDKSRAMKIDPGEFRDSLVKEDIDVDRQYALAHQLFQAGRLALACVAFADLAERRTDEQTLERRLQLLRDSGTAHFMLGKIEAANRFWEQAGELRRFVLGDDLTGPAYRIAGGSWFAAIGHVAMLDFYVKYNRLYRGDVRVVAQLDLSDVPGNYLCERLGGAGIDFIPMGRLQPDYDRWAKQHGKRRWDQLTSAERFAHIDDFWEFEFPDGQVLGYTHAASRIQRDWEREKRPPLLSLSDGERQFQRRALRLLGLPEGAWYVCLHVRESGFHKGWNSRYPSMRDATIEDYRPAIDLIVRSGGWVIRMGDPTMKKLPPLAHVVDYAHSSLKTPKADILLSLGCRFFLGTNSGIATIPAIYGVRCVFSNWLPVGLPLWPSQDLMIPKLMYDEKKGRELTLEEMFRSGLAFVQNWADLPEGIRLRDNTPEEIVALTAEALQSHEVEDQRVVEARAAYRRIAEENHSYVGSTLAASFALAHDALFGPRRPAHPVKGQERAGGLASDALPAEVHAD